MRRAVVLLVALAACSSAPPRDSGIEGIALLGPTCPVERAGEPCSDAPFHGPECCVVKRGGKTVATFRPNDAGRFVVNLAPGEYTIEQVGAGGPPTLAPVPVRVVAHRFTQVRLPFDSGIR